MPTVDIVIANWNTDELLTRCLDSVAANVAARPELDVTTIVVDNGSTDDSVARVRSGYPWVELIANTQNVGFARANNQGVARSRGSYVLLLNSDTVLHDDALGQLVEFLADHPQAGAAGARLLNGDGSLQASCHPMLTPGRELWRLLFLDRLWPRAVYRQERWDTVTPRPVEVIKGACLLLRRAALEGVGPLDERYFMYTEEVDLCFRLAQAGWSLWYVPTAVVTHFGGASSSQMAERMYLELYRSKAQFYRKTGGERRARQFKWATAAAYVPRVVLQPHKRVFRRLLWALPGM